MKLRPALAAFVAFAVPLAGPPRLLAHCDTLDGPVVKDARVALDTRDVTPVLKWIGADKEAEVRRAFQQALAVRALGTEARDLADGFFFETLVRLHREGEGAPFTGLKPAGAAVDPAVAAADTALDSGAVDPLVRMISARSEQGLRERFAHAAEAKAHAGESVEKGRAYVAAYVEFVHYAERLLQSATTDAAHAGHAEAAPPAVPEGHRH
jgi:hypothetical protein